MIILLWIFTAHLQAFGPQLSKDQEGAHFLFRKYTDSTFFRDALWLPARRSTLRLQKWSRDQRGTPPGVGGGREAAKGACGPGGRPGAGGGGGDGGAAGLAEASPSTEGDTAAMEGGVEAGMSCKRGSFSRSRCVSITSRCSPSSSQVIVYVGRLRPCTGE